MKKALLVFWFVFSVMFGMLHACDKWEYVNPVPQGNTIHDLHVIGSEVWAVGDFGLVMTSTDGENWTIRPRFTDLHLFGVSYGMGQWVIVAEDGWIFFSSNGVDWQSMQSVTEDLCAVALGTDDMGAVAFVVVGAGGRVGYSFNGANWYIDTLAGYSGDLHDVIFDTDRFVAVGENGCIAETSNLVDWESYMMGSPSEPWLGVSRAGSWLYICGDDGSILRAEQSLIGPWFDVSAPTTATINKVVPFDNQLFALGGRVYSSMNGDVWDFQWNMISPLNDGVVFSNIMVAAGTGGNHMVHDGAFIQHDPRMNSGTIRGVCHGPDAFLAVGDYGVLDSADGLTWQKINSSNPYLRDVTHFDGLYHAVTSNGAIKSSVDGMEWGEDYSVPGENLYGVASSILAAVAVGANGKVVKKEFNGTWNPLYLLGIDDLNDICHFWLSMYQGKFVAVGENGKIVTSADGTTWSAPSQTGTTNDLHSVTYHGGIYTAVGDGVIVQSNDADVWIPTHFLSEFSFDHVFWDGDRFCVFGTYDQDTVVFGTYDFLEGDWDLSFPALSSPIFDTVRYDGQLVGVGANSGIVVPGYPDLDLENWRQPYDVRDYTHDVNIYCQ